MASRLAVPQQARGEAVVGKQKNNGGQGRNRRALGDIGNLVTITGNQVAKPAAQITRPITRSFRAQLLANAKAASLKENNNKEKQVCTAVGVGGGGENVVAVKGVQKKVTTAKLKLKQVIEISPDTEEFKSKEKQGKIEKKKKEPTFTSVLTIRSKAACGVLANKPKEEIVDIDAKDANNDLAAVEYVEDIYKFYKLVENESQPCDYIQSQPEINEKMRSILVDWLAEVHVKFELQPETLYLTINIIDRFLSVKIVSRRELQLIGISAMLIASKYEEIWAPQVNDLVCIADRAYSDQQILVMEKTILGKLEWTLTLPTQYVFLARFIKAAASVPGDEQVDENMVYFLAELGMMHYDTIRLKYSPSMVAASAVYAARCTLNRTPLWTHTLELHTGYSESQVIGCAKLLALFHSQAAENKLQALYRKYSSSQRGAVALISPAKSSSPLLMAGTGMGSN